MNETAPETTARSLREAFDRSFAQPQQQEQRDTEDLLLLRAGGETYAVKAHEIVGIAAGKKIVPVPSSASAFLGMAGIKGSLVPVWSLAVLLGSAQGSKDPRWLLLGSGEMPWALAFDGIEGYAAVERSDIHPASADGAGSEPRPSGGRGEHIREACRAEGRALPVVSLGSVLETLRKSSYK